jgi:photosystem II stability/assembly factor-like uncharacterized protein
MAIALSHGGTTVYSVAAPSDEVLVGTLHGVVTLVRDGGWRIARRVLEDRHISAIIEEPDSGVLFAGAFAGGIHASTDGGRTWERRDHGVTEPDVYSLASVRLNGRARLYAGTEPARLFYSDDLGLSWSELPGLRAVPSVPRWTFPAPPHVAHAKHITFSPDDPSTIFVSIEQGGLLRSTDAGETWTELHTNGLNDDLHRLVLHPRDPRLLYANTGVGLHVSTDGGTTWEHRTTRTAEVGGYPDGLVLRPSRPEELFIGAAQHNPGDWRTSHFAGARISRSRDGGGTWEVLGGGLPDRLQASIEAMCLEEWDGGCAVFAATTAGEVWASEDGGESWACIARDLTPISKGGHYRPLVPA